MVYKNYDELPLMLSVKEIADLLGISKSSAYVLVQDKNFPSVKIGARVIVPKDKLIEWVNENVSE